MILYVNGDSHTAGAEAVNTHAFACDDPALFYMGRAPHPENLAVSWGKMLSLALRAGFHCGAESASSNQRILRTTQQWLDHNYNQDLLIVIQWSTWEREEWYDEETDTWFQVNASGIDHVPEKWQDRYREFVANVDWNRCVHHWHDQIWQFHQQLNERGIKHIFFNGNSDFSKITDKKDWGNNYIGPYDPMSTFSAMIQSQGIQTVAPNSWHFGRDGHSYFYRFMLQYIINNKLI